MSQSVCWWRACKISGELNALLRRHGAAAAVAAAVVNRANERATIKGATICRCLGQMRSTTPTNAPAERANVRASVRARARAPGRASVRALPFSCAGVGSNVCPHNQLIRAFSGKMSSSENNAPGQSGNQSRSTSSSSSGGVAANEAGKIRVRIVQASDHDRVLDFLRVHYYHEEPLTIGSVPKEQDAADEEFNMSNIRHGMCLMAVLSEGGAGESAGEGAGAGAERIVGTVISGPKDATESAHLFEEASRLGPTKWGHVLQFLACIERDCNVCQRYGVEKVLHAHVLSVDGSVRGHGIGARLMRDLMQLGRERGYPLLTVDCSSYYSARLCERLGMECVNTVKYAEYLDAEGRQVFNPPPPHDCIQTFAHRLSDSPLSPRGSE